MATKTTAQRIDCLDGPPIVGEFYLVPCIKRMFRDGHDDEGEWLPIIGPEHEDAGIVNFPRMHFHYDWRFMRKHTMDWLGFIRDGKASRVYGSVAVTGQHEDYDVIGPQWNRRKCHREFPPYPADYSLASFNGKKHHPWLDRLEDAHAGRTLPACKTCPHRGIPLRSVRAVDGTVTCPGHGLTWDVETGELVRTAFRGLPATEAAH